MSWGVRSSRGPKRKAWETAAKAILGDREIAVADCFRRQSLASLVGTMTLFHRAGALISLAVIGWIFQTQNHNLVLVIVFSMLPLRGAAFALARSPLPPVSLSVQTIDG